MAGYGLSDDNSLPVRREFRKRVIILRLLMVVFLVDWTLSEPDIDLIILCLGANDMLRGIQPKETKSNLEKIIKIAQDKNIEIILAGMIAPTSHGFSYKKI